MIETDILVIGGGLAGTYAAVKAKEYGAENVTLVDKSYVGKSGCSAFAAGVMTVFFPEDDLDAWMGEYVNHGEHLNDQLWLKEVLLDQYARVKEMEGWGINFEKDEKDCFLRVLGRGGAENRHMKNIMFHGPQLMEVMRKKVSGYGVKIIDRIMVTDLLTNDDKAVGAVGFDVRTGELKVFKAKATILAAGRVAFKDLFYANKNLTGESYAMVYKAGGHLMNFELCNANTTCKEFAVAGLNMFVGYGGRFLNSLGERFMERYDPIYKDRAVLHILAAAMAMEVKKGRGPIYFDLTHLTERQVKKLRVILPLDMMLLERAGVMVGDKIVCKLEWMPQSPNTMGVCPAGARVNRDYETTLHGLYAVGDAAAKVYTGVSGAGAAGLIFCAVSGNKAARVACGYVKEAGFHSVNRKQLEVLAEYATAPLRRKEGIDPVHVILAVQEVIIPFPVAFIRNKGTLEIALKEIEEIRDNQLPFLRANSPHELVLVNEARSMTLCAEVFLRSALFREESRGSNLREDYPEIDNINWLKWTCCSKENGRMKVAAEEVPINNYPIKPEKEKVMHVIFSGAGKKVM